MTEKRDQDIPTDPEEIPIAPPGVQLKVLSNGLTVIVGEDHSAPVAAAQVWCRSGSIHEGRWLGGGLSHMLEHMLFKGTVNRTAGQIDREVQEAGGYVNAYTSFDHTVYLINVPSREAATAIDILCDISQNATLPEDELTQEKQVIRREMDMWQDDPTRQAAKRLFETTFIESPYRFPIIGIPDIFDELSRADLLAYYHEQYAPDNLFFVVTGDVDPELVFQQIRDYFAPIKARPRQPAVLPVEPKQTAPRELVEEGPFQLSHFYAAWHIPDIRHPDVPAIELLATVLGGGVSSRLFQQVREKTNLVHAIDAWTYVSATGGLLGISSVMDAERFPKAREAILTEARRICEQGIGLEELSKAVKQVRSSTYAGRKTMQGQATELGGNWLSIHDLNFSERYLARIHSVTPSDIQRVAEAYFAPENRSIYGLLPTGTTPKPDIRVDTATDRPVQKFQLPNGLRVLVKENHHLPFIEYRAVFQGGVLRESPKLNGVSHLAAKMLLKGTPTRSAEEIAAQMESIGGHIDSYSGNNSFGISAETLGSDLAAGLDILADTLRRPTFPQEALERERLAQIATIREQKDHLLQRASHLMRRRFFGEVGYGLDIHGSESSVAALTESDLHSLHSSLAIPENCVLALYGDLTSEEALDAVKARLGDWQPYGRPLPPLPGPTRPTTRERVTEQLDKKQAVIVIGFPGATIFDPDRFALELIQEIYSDIGSRLFQRIRDELGLAYYVGAQNRLGLIPGCFAFFAGTAPDSVARVEDEILREVESLAAHGLTSEELRRAKAKLLGQKKIARQELGSYAMATALDELYGLGYDATDQEDEQIEAVSEETIREVARKYLRPAECIVAVVGPREGSSIS